MSFAFFVNKAVRLAAADEIKKVKLQFYHSDDESPALETMPWISRKLHETWTGHGWPVRDLATQAALTFDDIVDGQHLVVRKVDKGAQAFMQGQADADACALAADICAGDVGLDVTDADPAANHAKLLLEMLLKYKGATSIKYDFAMELGDRKFHPDLMIMNGNSTLMVEAKHRLTAARVAAHLEKGRAIATALVGNPTAYPFISRAKGQTPVFDYAVWTRAHMRAAGGKVSGR